MYCINNNNNANICIARLKQNSSGALMAQTNTVSVLSKWQQWLRVESQIGRKIVRWSKLLLQWLRSSFCQVLFLSQWQRDSRTQQIEDVVGSPPRWPAHSQQLGMVAPVRADTCRPSPPACRRCACEPEPVKFAQDWRDVVELPGLCRDTSCSVLDSLQLLEQAVVYTVSRPKLLQ